MSSTTSILLSLSIALLSGLLLSRLAKRVQLPAVTAYLVAGVLIGPFLLGALGDNWNIPGLGISHSQLEGFGIIADVAAVCAKYRANILDITQTVLSEYFAMIMLTDIDALDVEFADFADALAKLGEGKGLMIHAMHEDIFNTMHHI